MAGVVLFNCNYLYQSGDTKFHLSLVSIGIRRGNPLICAEHSNKAIMGTKQEYFLVSYDDKDEFIKRYGLEEAYTPDDFIEKLAELRRTKQ